MAVTRTPLLAVGTTNLERSSLIEVSTGQVVRIVVLYAERSAANSCAIKVYEEAGAGVPVPAKFIGREVILGSGPDCSAEVLTYTGPGFFLVERINRDGNSKAAGAEYMS